MVNILRFKDLNSQLNSLNLQDENCFNLVFFETKGWYRYKREKKSATAGELLFLNPRNRESIKEIKGLGWFIAFKNSMLMAEPSLGAQVSQSSNSLLFQPILNCQESKIHRFYIPLEKQFKWIIRLNWLEEELNKSHDFSNSATQAILKLLIIDIVRLSAAHYPQKFSYSDPLLNRVFKFIESNYQEAISLSDVAKKVNKSTSYLTNLVKQKTGKTVLQWIVELRMAKARSLLLETDCSVETIAETVGYLDLRHFSRQFRRIHGLSPKQWKLLHLQDLSSDAINNRIAK